MSENLNTRLNTGYFVSILTLLSSSSSLICCAIPALLVSLGAGSALASIVSIFPQITWISENKDLIFILSTLMLVAGGLLQWKMRATACPTDSNLREACTQTRNTSKAIYLISVIILAVGAWFAYVQPLLT